MGCQKDIVEKIVDKGADYVVSLKGNQGALHNDVALFFEHAAKSNFRDVDHDYYEETDGGHGRVEIRVEEAHNYCHGGEGKAHRQQGDKRDFLLHLQHGRGC
jgi:predicted transposase YbfD/YdcC